MELQDVNSATEYSLPLPLANAKNRQLQQKVRDKRNRLAQLLQELDQNENIVKTTEQEITTLEQSTQQTNVLANNIRSQVRKEREVINLISTETSNLEQETRRLQQGLNQLSKNHESQKKRVEQQNHDYERLERVFEEEEKFVSAMEKMVESQLEDHTILEKYSHEDNLTIKDLEIKLARTKEDIDDVERQFKAAKEDRENTAIQLQKMQEEFRAMTDDRDQNLERWEMTVAQAESCLRQLEKSRSDYQGVKELANADQNRLDSINRCIKQFQEDITGLERAYHLRDVFASQLKIKIDGIEKIQNEQQAEYIAFEKVAKRLTTEIMTSRKGVDSLKEKAKEVQTKLTEAQDKYKQSEKELEEFRNTVLSAKAQKESLASLAKGADERLARQRNHLNTVANEFVTVQNELSKVKAKLNSCLTNMKFNIHNIRNLENHISSIKQKLNQQEELVYKKNMETVRIEMELRRLRFNDGEAQERNQQRQQIEALKTDLDASNAHLVALKHEVSKTQSDAIGLQRSCDLQQQKKNVMQTLSKQLESECQSKERESNDLRRELEEIRMGESLIHLEIKRRESMIQMRSAVVQHLENQKKEIEKAIQIRLEELSNQMELLQLESRSLKERNQQLMIDVNKRAHEVERIKIRYGLVADTLVMENGIQETSEAYIIIKMAQEKELVKESISDLQNTVYNLENDNSALSSTLQLVSSSNQQFRQCVIVGLLTDDDKALKNKMESENQCLEKMADALRKEMFHHCHLFERLDQEIRQLNQDAYRAKFHVDEKGIARKDIVEEVERLQAKIGRAKDINLVLQKTIRRARKTKSKLSEEIDFEIYQMQSKCLSAQSSIFRVTQDDSDAKATLIKLLTEVSMSNAGDVSREVKELLIPALPKTRLEIKDFPHPTMSSSPPSSTTSGK